MKRAKIIAIDEIVCNFPARFKSARLFSRFEKSIKSRFKSLFIRLREFLMFSENGGWCLNGVSYVLAEVSLYISRLYTY